MAGILGVSNLGEDVNKIRQDIDKKQSINPPELTEEGYDLSVLPDQGEQDVVKQGSEQKDDIYYDVSNLPDDNPPISQESLNAIWQSQAMFDSYKQSVDADPDNEAKIQSLEKETGLPRWYIEKNPQDAEKRTQQEPDFTAIARDYPTLSKFIMDPAYMAISKDDIETLGEIEKIIGTPGTPDTDIGQGKRTLFFAKEGTKDVVRNVAQFIKMIDDISGEYSNVTGAEQGFEFDPMKYYAERGETQPKNLIKMIADSSSLQPSGKIQRGTGVQGYIDDLVRMGPQIAAQIATGLVGGPMAGLAMMFPQIAGSDYENLRNQGVSEGRAAIAAMADASLQSPLESLGLTKALGMLKSSAPMSILIKQIADAAGTEFVTEWIQQYPQAATELWATTEGMSQKDRAQKFLEDFAQNTVEGMYQGLVAAPFGLAGGSGKILYEFQKARVAERNASRTEAISNLVKESKLAKRDPGVFSELIKKFAPEGQNAVFWPVTAFDSYFQSEADNKAQELGLSDQLQEARATNGSLEIPIEDFATKIASTENVETIKNDIKYEPDGLTVNEAQQFDKEEMGRQVKEELNRSEEILKQQNEEGKAFQYVVDNVKGQLMANGMDNQSAEDNATLFASGMNAFAKRVGKSITDVFKRVGLQITGKEMVDGMFQPAYHGSPYRFNEFDIDRIGSGEGAQAYGWGLYFAGNKDIAEWYKRKLQDDIDTIKSYNGTYQYTNMGWQWNEFPEEGSSPWNFIEGLDNQNEIDGLDIFRDFDFDKDKAIQAIDQSIKNPSKATNSAIDYIIEDDNGIKRLEDAKEFINESGLEISEAGQLYEVDIPEDNTLLNWDNPLSEQPEYVKDKIKSIYSEMGIDDTSTGEEIYKELQKKFIADKLGYDPQSPEAVSKYLNSLGINGIKYLDASSRAAKEGTHNYVIFDDAAVDIIDTFYQNKFSFDTGYQGKDGPFRGQVSFSDGRTIISLFNNADESTFLHETGHVLYNMLGEFAKDENAPQELRDDWESVREWLGLEEGQELSVEDNETLARSFESYLMEGKAPSTKLRKAFRTFKNWLISIYRSVTNLSVDMDDNIRDVMDRLVATREEIDAMEQQAGFDQAFKENVDKGLADDSYYKVRQEARDKTEGKLLRRKMRPLTKDGKADIAREKEESKARITDEVKADPKYQLYDLLTKTQDEGGFKLNKDSLVEEYGEDYVKGLPKKIYSKDGQYTADEVANLILKPEYTSGDEMLRDMQELKPEKQEIKSRLDAHMQQYIAEMTATNQEMANEVITSDEWLDVLIKEHELLLPEDVRSDKQALKRRQGALRKAAKDSAEAVIANKQARMLKPAQYIAQMQKANREYLKALSDEDYTGAREEVERQILNQALANEALKRKRDVDSSRKKFKRLARQKSNTSSIEIGYLDQIKSLLSDINLAHMTDKKRAEMQSRRDFFQKQAKDNGEQIYMPDKYINEAFKKPFDEMTVSEIRDVRDVIDNLEHVGRTKKKLITAQDKRQVVDAKEAFMESANKNMVRRYQIDRDPRVKLTDRLFALPKWMGAKMLTAETMFEQLDGWEDMGPCWTNTYGKLRDCADTELIMQEKASKQLKAIFEPYSVSEMSKKVYIDKIGMSLTRNNLLAFGLNMGAEDNINRLLETWSSEELEAIKDQLTEKDIQTIRAIWKLSESYYGESNNTLRTVSGISMKKTKTVTFNTKFGDFEGGYYHIGYDLTKEGSIARMQEEEEMLVPKRHYLAGAAPKRGFTKERAKVVKGKQVSLDVPSVLGRHLQEVIHFISFAEGSKDVRRLLSDTEVRTAIQEMLGEKKLREIDTWLRDVVFGEQRPSDFMDHLLHRVRTNTTFAMLGGNFVVALGQSTSYPAFAERLGVTNMAMGLIEFWGNPTSIPDKIKFVLDNSVEMRSRSRTFHADIKDTIGDSFIKDWRKSVVKGAFSPLSIVDMATACTGWYKAYKMDLKKTMDHDHAVKYADYVVRNTQPAGQVIDRAGIQRDSELNKMVSMFYTWMSKVYNQTYRSLSKSERSIMDGNLKFIPTLATTAMCSWFLPAVGYALLHGQEPDDEDDKLWWATKKTALYPLQSIILVREIMSMFEPQLSPVEGMLKTANRLVGELGKIPDDEADLYKITNNLVEVAGYSFGLPSRMMLIPLKYMEDYLDGEESEFEIMRLFFRDYNKE